MSLPDTLLLDNRPGARPRFLKMDSSEFRQLVDFFFESFPSSDKKVELLVDEEGMYKDYKPNIWAAYLVNPATWDYFDRRGSSLLGPIILYRESGLSLELLQGMIEKRLLRMQASAQDLTWIEQRRAEWNQLLLEAQQ